MRGSDVDVEGNDEDGLRDVGWEEEEGEGWVSWARAASLASER